MLTTNDLIVVTGAAGFIGSCLVGHLNEKGFNNLVIVDEFVTPSKSVNLEEKKFAYKIDRDQFFKWLVEQNPPVKFIFHLGARTDTTEFDYEVHRKLNLEYSQHAWNYCVQHKVPLVYASSAATYGAGELGYDDSHDIIKDLKPLNPYGESKNDFDKWVLEQKTHPPFWAGLKFFNVYGPYEYHKGRMASVIWHSFNQIKNSGKVKLFKSHRPDFKDGEQLRDFIYVKDLLKVCFWLMQAQPASAIYNLGTGKARTFADLVKATFTALGLQPNIRFIDMPEDIRDKYQYFTEANMKKLRAAGYTDPFYSLEDGVKDYVSELPGTSLSTFSNRYIRIMKNKIAIIGGGNLGTAIAEGLIASRFSKPADIIVTKRNTATLKPLEKKGVYVTSDNNEAVKKSGIVILAIKPYQVKEVVDLIKKDLTTSHILVSVVTGVSIKDIEESLKKKIPVFRAMPNTAIAIRESMTCLSHIHATTEQAEHIHNIFSTLGKVVTIDEKLMDAATVLGACGTAYAMRYIRANIQGGIEIGFDAATASLIAAQTVKGAAELLLQRGSHPEYEIDKVTTPKGCTIAGLNEMEHRGFSSSVMKGVVASYDKILNS